MVYVQFSKSNVKNKRFKAVFYDDDKIRFKTVHFGLYPFKKYGAYIDHKDEELKKNYIKRHRVNEDWNDEFKAGTLSKFILWNKKSLNQSINDYVKHFKLKKLNNSFIQ